MVHDRLDTWLRWLRGTATFVAIAALCLSVALLVIALVPGSPVTQDLPAGVLTRLSSVGGVTAGASPDPSGWIPFTVSDPSLAQRLLYLLTLVPGLLLIGEIARRMANLLRAAQARDPFMPATVRALLGLAKLTAFGGLGTWAVSEVMQGLLVETMVRSAPTFTPHGSPLGWLAVGLIFAGLGRILDRGVAMRAELDMVV